MTDVERQLLLAEARMLKASIERLESTNAALMVEIAAVRSEYARAVADNERLAESSADQFADNARLRAALRMVVDKGRAIPKAEADGTADVLIVLQDNEWGVVLASLSGYPDEPGEAAHP